MNERERQPDREGYVAFRQRVEARGATPFEALADWFGPAEKRGPQGQYLELLSTEDHLRQLHAEPAEAVLREVQRYMPELREDAMRPAVRKEVNQILRRWAEERARSSEDYLLQEKDFERQVAQRQREHPSETPGQSWFRVRAETQCACRDHLYEQKLAVRDALMRARRERKAPQLGDPGYAEYREQQRGKDRGGRER